MHLTANDQRGLILALNIAIGSESAAIDKLTQAQGVLRAGGLESDRQNHLEIFQKPWRKAITSDLDDDMITGAALRIRYAGTKKGKWL